MLRIPELRPRDSNGKSEREKATGKANGKRKREKKTGKQADTGKRTPGGAKKVTYIRVSGRVGRTASR